MRRSAPALIGVVCIGSVAALAAQDVRIGIIDFYGLKHLSPAALRPALTFKEGDALTMDGGTRPASLVESEQRLSRVPGVAHARTEIVCCDDGRIIVYVGIEETDARVLRFRPAPVGSVRLPPEVVKAGEDFEDALIAAVQRGVTGEDQSRGHALNDDPAERAIQEGFVEYAQPHVAMLRRVMRESGDAAHRALAAQVIGYVRDKQAAVADLVAAMEDPDGKVRNNAMRTLLVFAAAKRGASPKPPPRVPFEPFVRYLDSPIWTDRNKASGALDMLSASRDPALLAALRRDAIAPVAEMARWQSAGHARPAFIILARIAGYADAAAEDAWERGDRETVITAAENSR